MSAGDSLEKLVENIILMAKRIKKVLERMNKDDIDYISLMEKHTVYVVTKKTFNSAGFFGNGRGIHLYHDRESNAIYCTTLKKDDKIVNIEDENELSSFGKETLVGLYENLTILDNYMGRIMEIFTKRYHNEALESFRNLF